MHSPFDPIRAFVLDMDGTIYLGDRLLPHAQQLLPAFDARGVEYLFLTNNSSRDRAYYQAKLGRLGIEVPEDAIFTSGEATALHLAATRPGARLYVVGTDHLRAEMTRHGFVVTDEEPEVVVLGFDTDLSYPTLTRLCDLVRAGLPYVATHPDFNCPVDGGYIPDTGATIAFVEASTGRRPDLVVGKPNSTMIEALLGRLGLPPESIAMVGDRLYTDIAMGKRAGILAVLTLTGETSREDLEASEVTPDVVIEDLGDIIQALGSR